LNNVKSPYPYPPPRRKAYLAIAIPSSTVSNEPTLELKTLKIGFIARASSIHRVDEIIVYKDKLHTDSDAELIVDVLEYLRTPPYLRKLIVPLKQTLRFVGVLPPLQTPNHPQSKSVKVGEYREGLVVEIIRGKAVVNIGLNKPAIVRARKGLKKGDLVIVKIVETASKIYGELVQFSKVPYYFGYNVSYYDSLSEVLKEKWDLKVATSKYGEPVDLERLRVKYFNAKSILIAFGAPKEGLWDITAREGLVLNEVFDIVVNTIPYQGVEVVRTEEAIHATLEIFSLIDEKSKATHS